jgi:hypothetical protein
MTQSNEGYGQVGYRNEWDSPYKNRRYWAETGDSTGAFYDCYVPSPTPVDGTAIQYATVYDSTCPCEKMIAGLIEVADTHYATNWTVNRFNNYDAETVWSSSNDIPGSSSSPANFYAYRADLR